MLSHRLIQLIQDHADGLTREALQDLLTNSRTPSFRKVPCEEIEARIGALYRNLGNWIGAPDDAVRAGYEDWGRKRFRQGIPVSELIYTMILAKHHLRRYIRDHGLVEFSGDRIAPAELLPLQMHSLQEANTMIGEFFDRALYHLARGYELEGAADRPLPAPVAAGLSRRWRAAARHLVAVAPRHRRPRPVGLHLRRLPPRGGPGVVAGVAGGADGLERFALPVTVLVRGQRPADQPGPPRRGGIARRERRRGPPFPALAVDYERVVPFKQRLLDAAWRRFVGGARPDLRVPFEEFCARHSEWLEDYGLHRHPRQPDDARLVRRPAGGVAPAAVATPAPHHRREPRGRSGAAGPGVVVRVGPSHRAVPGRPQPRRRGADERPWPGRGQLALAVHGRHAVAGGLRIAA